MPSGQPATVACPDPERMWPSLIALVHEYALLLLDPDGRILSWNRGAELIKGYGAAEIIGRHFSCLYPPEDIAAGCQSANWESPPPPAAARPSASTSARMARVSSPTW